MAKKKQAKKKSPPQSTQKKPAAPTAAAKRTPRGKSSKKRGAGEPSRPTVKRLFAVSGNRRAFPGCKTPIVDPNSGSIIGQICHIKGENLGSARYDERQPAEERQGFVNLVLMCAPHHKIIDDDERTYTVQCLKEMKKLHEAGKPTDAKLTDEQADRLIASISGNTVTHGSILHAHNQTGGQMAHEIHNYQQAPPQDKHLHIEGTLSTAADTNLLTAFGCPGLKLLVVNRGKRTAKIRGAVLSLEGTNLIGAFQRGFGHNFGYTPPEQKECRKESFVLTMIPLSHRNRPEGYVLERDDTCSFFLPINPGLGMFRESPPENMAVHVTMFDDSEVELIRGQQIREYIDGLIEVYGRYKWEPKVPVEISLQTRSTTLPDVSCVGKTNPNPVSFVEPPIEERVGSAPARKIAVGLGVVGSPTREYTLGIQVANISPEIIEGIAVAFVAESAKEVPFVAPTNDPLPPGHERSFVLPFQTFPEVRRLASTLQADRFGFVIRSSKEELLCVPGDHVHQALAYLGKVSRGEADAQSK
jgi:hypothetical protein